MLSPLRRRPRAPAAPDPWAPQVAQPPLARVALVAAIAAALAALVLAAVLGWTVSDSVAPEPVAPAAPSVRIASVGPLRVAIDGAWKPAAAPPEATVAGLSDAHAFTPVAGAPTTAWIARAPTDDPTLVPAALRELVVGDLPRAKKVKVAERPAWSYRRLELAPGRLTTLTIAPTASGALVIGCSAPQSWWSASSGCATGIRSVAGPAAVAPSSDLAARARLPKVLKVLNTERRAGRRSLRAARKPAAQARAARRLARAHRKAGTGLSRVVAPGTPAQRLQAALRRTGRGYDSLATAASRGWPGRYRMAKQRIRRAERTARHELAALRRGSGR